jgi:hypothetical protein
MRRFLILFLLGVLLAACDQSPSAAPTVTRPTSAASSATTAPAGQATATGAYPAPEGAYPAPTTAQTADGYPVPGNQGPEFTFNLPVRAADSQVSGKGPAGVPIKLVNVARSGEVVGETTIGGDGAFTISVPAKLTAGDRVALMLGNTAGTNVDPNDFLSGPGYQDYPLIGILLTSTVVE